MKSLILKQSRRLLQQPQCKNYSVESINYCRNLVRENDYPGYLSCLLFPAGHRDACFSILAYNLEMRSIRKQCNNNSIAGRMRFQWWRALLDDIYINAEDAPGADRTGEALSQHPVVEVLSESVQKYSLTKRWLERILESRQARLDFQRPQSMSSLEDIAENSHSSLLYLQSELLGVESDDAAYAASHIGVCKGMVRLLQGALDTDFEDPGYVFPVEVLAKHGLDVESLHHGPDGYPIALQDVVHDIASQAYAHMERGRQLQQKVSAPVYPLLSAVPEIMYLEKLKDCNFDIAATNKATADHFFVVRLQMRLLSAKWRGFV